MRCLALALCFAFAASALPAQEKPVLPKGECPLCRLPNRAALLAGAAAPKCPADCANLCCTGTQVTYLVEGLVCTSCTDQVTAALAKLDGVHVEAACHNTGQVLLKYDPAKVKPAKLVAAITRAGHPVTGEKASFPVAGMTDDKMAERFRNRMVRHVGVSDVHAAAGAPATVVIVFDPKRTNLAKITAAVGETRLTLAED